jgi:class 3 adenylate cyclase/tetratricopeptide (TPR) repeat protein
LTTAVREASRSYVPRLAREWDEAAPEARARTLDASLLGLDVSGFTALSERLAQRGKVGAEELVRLISLAYAGLIDIADRHGGDVLKFRGDALLMLFDGAGHEARAARAATDMQAYITATGTSDSSVGPVTLGMAAGLVSGPCHLFLVGASRRELIVCGPAASATLELEDLAEAGEILVSARTAEALPAGAVGGGREGAFLLRHDTALDAPPPPLRDAAGASDLMQFLPPALRSSVTTGAIEAEHRHAVAAFLKFSGGDALALEGEGAAATLGALADVVTDVTDELGVTWLESDIDRDGGKLYLVAGAPASTGDEEERMLRAVRSIVDAGVGPTIAVGVNRGPVLAGPIGSWSRRTYAVMGDTVNLAARLAARAEKREILVTGDVVERSHTRFETTARQFLMKGKSQPVTGYSLGAPAAEAEEPPPAESLPLVGRDAELAVLREAVDAARLRQSRAIELVGEPGAGKSRILEELVTTVAGFQVLRGQCDAYSASTPFAPFGPILRPLVGALPEDTAEAAGAKLTTFVQSVMPDLAPWLPLLALPFHASVDPTPEVDEFEPSFRRDRLHDALEQFLLRILLMPTLLVVEDTHWLDDASQLVLKRLSQAGPRPWLLVFTRRPAGDALVGDGTVLELAPLSADAARELALAAAGETVLSEEQLDAVTARAAGNPLFVRELAAAPSDVDAALPETVESLLTARIDTLDAADRRLLRHASVIGTSFELDLLAEILPDEAGDDGVWERLDEFVDRESDSTIRFRHDLVRAAAYDSLAFERRREIHFAVATALERRVFDPTSVAEILSLHFLAASLNEQAWRYAVIAGDGARSKYANLDASTFYRRALAASGGFDAAPAEVARVAEALGDVLELAAHYDDADLAYERALELSPQTTRLLRKRAITCERRGRYDDALDLYDRAEAGADAEEAVAAHLGRAIVLYRKGRIDECALAATEAADGASALDDRSALADAYYIRAAAEGDRGGPAREFLQRALAIFQELGLLHREATVLNNLGVRAYYEGAWDDAFDLYRRAEETVRRAGDVLTGGHATNNRAEILLDQGRLAEAADLFGDALRTYRAAKFPIGEALVSVNLGRLAAAEGRFAAAHVHFDEGEALLRELGSESFLVEAAARRAEAYVLEGRCDDASALAQSALDAMQRLGELGVRSALLERLLGLAKVQARRPEDAGAHFDRSLAVARSLRAEYEVARTLHARVVTGLATEGDAASASAIMARLGVVAIPPVPIP